MMPAAMATRGGARRRRPTEHAVSDTIERKARPSTPSGELDAIDYRLLALLAEDARRSYADLAQDVGLSPPSVFARIKKLEERGVIRAYTIMTDPAQLGHDLAAWIAVRQLPGFHWEHLEAAFREMPQVEACYSVTGDETYVLLAHVANPRSLEDLLREINCLEGVSSTRTMLILSTVFERRRLD
jgi:Lrp/AsnC family leucine-responsive transcriptional regulator